MSAKHSPEADRGAVLVLVAILLTVFLGMAAVVLDLGRLYIERRELQNGADAAALAIAQDCALLAACDTDNDPLTELAEPAAQNNARDGEADVDNVCGVGAGLSICTEAAPTLPAGWLGWTRVDTSTRTADGQNDVDMLFAPIIGKERLAVSSDAAAAWGLLGAAPAFPFTISQCTWERSLAADTTPDDGVGPIVTLYAMAGNDGNDINANCPTSNPGGTAGGNFGFLDPDSNIDDINCVPVVVGEWADGQTGVSGQDLRQCVTETELRTLPVLVPIFNDVDDSGTSADCLPFSVGAAAGALPNGQVEYCIIGFGLFQVTAYKIPAFGTWPRRFDCPTPVGVNGDNQKCFQGYFLDRGLNLTGTIGEGPDFGVRAIQMVG